MILLIFYILIIILSYFSLIIYYLIKWLRYKIKTDSNLESLRHISLLIPVYNEKENLIKLLNSLKNQSLSKKNFEVIIIDDHSKNSLENLLRIPNLKDLNLSLLQNKYEQGKKHAIKTGVESAKNEWIVTTDADCVPHNKWLESIYEAFKSKNPKLISAPVVMSHKNSFFQKFQAFEFSSLVATGAASIASGSPIMCNGANLAFQKDLFLNAFPELKPEVKTGDDIFLLEYAKKHFPADIIFLKNYDAIVTTVAESGLLDFFRQRIRWTSKSLYYKDPLLIFVSSLVFLLNLNILITTALSFINPDLLYSVIIQYGIKSIADFLFLRNFFKFLRLEKLMWMFPIVQIIYPYYIILVSVSGIIKSFYNKYVKVFKK